MLNKKLRMMLVLFLIMSFSVFAGELKNNLQLMKGNAKDYIRPIVTGFGTATNSGLYKKAKVKPGGIAIPFGVDVGIVGNIVTIPEEDKTFNFEIPDNSFNYTVNYEGQSEDVQLSFKDLYNDTETATAASDKEGSQLDMKDSQTIADAINNKTSDDFPNISEEDVSELSEFQSPSLPNGLGASEVYMGGLQVSVRLPFVGVELTGRGFPKREIGDYGEIGYIGGGIRKSLPVPIIDVTAGVFYQHIGVGDILSTTNMNYNLVVGKSLGLPFMPKISPYAGVGLDQTSVELDYQYTPTEGDTENINLEMEGENTYRMTAGVTAQIIPFTYLNLEVAKLTNKDYLSGTVSLGFMLK